MARPARFTRNVRGQALLEYSLVTAALVGLVLFGSALAPLPGGQSLLELLADSFTRYLDSYTFVLSLPFP